MKRFIPVFYGFVPRPCSCSPGKHAPLRGQRESPVFLPNPQAFIMPEMADREIELDRIDRVDGAQGRSDVGGHAPAGTLQRCQAQALADADDVRVERHDELSGPHLLPHTEIDLVLTHHPAQEQVEPLAGAARRWAREEVGDAGFRFLASVDLRHVECQRARREGLQRFADVNGIAGQSFSEETSRSIRCDRSSDAGSTRVPRSRRHWSSDGRDA